MHTRAVYLISITSCFLFGRGYSWSFSQQQNIYTTSWTVEQSVVAVRALPLLPACFYVWEGVYGGETMFFLYTPRVGWFVSFNFFPIWNMAVKRDCQQLEATNTHTHTTLGRQQQQDGQPATINRKPLTREMLGTLVFS
ncbi:uncharacterized protein B0I36DRAFT_105248 [Microdochium trichocladiopsis]|uniref:Uncharacterized protein n=1 Tax=Microdochium trichocladiopsis TaxID=1682393 RepID=A0A9P8Y6P1_9PEZI|nr:uncharacterized protein B0I36DRAFT_105248 [Microdochium trichocladiopsis]KAH7033120.1 hypothetical protein B0I36DRAFT_105248 [Microdochium trichocladiopsis]